MTTVLRARPFSSTSVTPRNSRHTHPEGELVPDTFLQQYFHQYVRIIRTAPPKFSSFLKPSCGFRDRNVVTIFFAVDNKNLWHNYLIFPFFLQRVPSPHSQMVEKPSPSAVKTVKFVCGPFLRARIQRSSTWCGRTQLNPDASSPTFGASILLSPSTSTGSGFGISLNQVRFAGGPPTSGIQGAFHHYLGGPLP